jgi:tryptophan 2-monooxygenase
MTLLPPIKNENDRFSPWPSIDSMYDYLPFLRQPIATLPAARTGTEVAVIGAGAAGLAAAHELLKIGLKPVIFEATDRIGGRLCSRHFQGTDGTPAAAFAELGAMRIPRSSRVFFHYAEQFGLRCNDIFPDPGLVDTLLHYKNLASFWNGGTPVPEPFRAVDAHWRHFIKPLVEKIHRPWREGDFAGVRKIWQEYLERYKGRSLYEVIRNSSAVWQDEEMRCFGALGIGTGGFGSLYHVEFLEILRVVVQECEEQQMLVEDGVESLARGFYERPVRTPSGEMRSLRDLDCLHLKTPVDWISYHEGNPTLSYRDPATGTEVRRAFPAVIVATTARAMQMLGLTIPPPDRADVLTTGQKAAMRHIHHLHSSKMFIRTATKFWKGTSLPLTIQSDELPRGFYLLDYPQTENGVVCMSYTWGDDSVKLIGLKPKERFEIIRECIRRIMPEMAAHLVPLNDEIIQIDWSAEPYYYGAFKLNLPGQGHDTSELYHQFLSVLTPEDKGIYLAGDCVSFFGGWVEGALHTGINAASAVAKRLGGELAPGSPLEQDPLRHTYV